MHNATLDRGVAPCVAVDTEGMRAADVEGWVAVESGVELLVLVACSGLTLDGTALVQLRGGDAVYANASVAATSDDDVLMVVKLILTVSSLQRMRQSAIAGDALYWYKAQWLQVEIRVRCSATTLTTVSAARVSITPNPMPSVTQVVAVASTVAAWGGGVAGVSTTAMMVGRVGGVRQLLLCNGVSGTLSIDGGLLGVHMGSAPCTWMPGARGAVIGNVAALTAAAVVVWGVGTWWWRVHFGHSGHVRDVRLAATESAFRVALPSCLLSLWVAAVPSSAGATVWLVTAAAPCTDVPVGVIGGVFCVAPIGLLVFVVVRGPGALFGLLIMPRRKRQQVTDKRWLWRCIRWVRSALARQFEWRRGTEEQGGASPATMVSASRAVRAVLLEHRRVWYAPVDVTVLVIISGLGAASGLLADTTCRISAAFVVALLGIQLLLCVVTRPLTSRFSNATAALTLLLSVVSCSAQLWSLLGNGSSGLTAAYVASACDLMSCAIAYVKLAIADLPSVVHSLRRLAHQLRYGSHALPVAGSLLIVSDDVELAEMVTEPMTREVLDAATLELSSLPMPVKGSSDMEGISESIPTQHSVAPPPQCHFESTADEIIIEDGDSIPIAARDGLAFLLDDAAPLEGYFDPLERIVMDGAAHTQLPSHY